MSATVLAAFVVSRVPAAPRSQRNSCVVDEPYPRAAQLLRERAREARQRRETQSPAPRIVSPRTGAALAVRHLVILAVIVVALSICIFIVAVSNVRFQRATSREVRALLAQPRSAAAPRPIQEADLDHLPVPVARWLRRAGVVGKPPVRVVRLRQRGQLRAAVDQPFLPAEAEQVFTTEVPGFVWSVRALARGVLPLRRRDSYLGGHGHMRICAAGTVPVVDAAGPEIDQGSLLRFLGEMVWFPSAALSPYLHWRGFDDRVAEATMSHHGLTLSARFSFDDKGRVTGFSARRYLGGGSDTRLERWAVRIDHWQRWNDVEVPSHGVVEWKLAEGDFEYYRWAITDLEYDPEPATVEHMSHRAAPMQTDVVAVRG